MNTELQILGNSNVEKKHGETAGQEKNLSLGDNHQSISI
jgi:hypothetical protein